MLKNTNRGEANRCASKAKVFSHLMEANKVTMLAILCVSAAYAANKLSQHAKKREKESETCLTKGFN